jgi:aminopeptidase
MSTKAYILPIDPNLPPSQSAIPNVDPAKLWSTVPANKQTPKVGTTRLFYGVPSAESNVTALVSLGEGFESQKGNGKREVVRKAVGSAVKDIKALVEGDTAVSVDASEDPYAAGKFMHVPSIFVYSYFMSKLSLPTWHFISSH